MNLSVDLHISHSVKIFIKGKAVYICVLINLHIFHHHFKQDTQKNWYDHLFKKDVVIEK